MVETEWGNVIGTIKLPRELCVSCKELRDILALYGESIQGNIPLDVFWPTLFNEGCQILISDNPDLNNVETSQMVDHLHRNLIPFNQYSFFRQHIVDSLKRPLTDIEHLRCMWREHANPHLTWELSDDQLLIIVKFTPVYPTRAYDELLRNAVNEAMANGEFVPYKYLRVLGLC